VDALSTAIIMELDDVVDDILEHLANVDFSTTDSSVSVFETTIRYLAGMLSGYDLLSDKALSHLASNVTAHPGGNTFVGGMLTVPPSRRMSTPC
jgi:mannosyl-oligosaccharide alpha-1,2-mannosidase